MVRRRAAGAQAKKTVRHFSPDMQSEWHLVPKDILSKVFAQSSSLSCVARQVCKAWRQHSISCPVSLDISLASPDDQTSLGLWLHAHKPEPSLAETAKTGNLSSTSDVRLTTEQQALSALLAAPNLSQTTAHALAARLLEQTVPMASAQSVQHISSLKLNMWLDFKGLQDILDKLAESFLILWAGLSMAHISELTLGEFLSNVFCHVIPRMVSLPSFNTASGLRNLQSLTLQLNTYCMHDIFRPQGCLAVLSMLRALLSFTLKASEVDVNGERKKQQVLADRLLTSLPDSIQSLCLENFRGRWQGFGDLSSKPGLVKLDLSRSSCIFPADPQAWTQLQQLKLRNSLVWLLDGQMFQFSALTQLTQLDLGSCYFAQYSHGQIHNTHQCVYRQMQVPPSIISLDLCTRGISGFVVKDKLTALTALSLHNACEVLDDKAQLQSLPGVQATFDTLNSAYHGEWWGQLKRLYTKCPCNVALGVPGHFPEGLEFLSLRTCCPEPLTVSTGVMNNQPKAYPHRAVPGHPSPDQAMPGGPDQARLGRRGGRATGPQPANKAEAKGKGKGRSKGRTLTLQAAAACSVLPFLHTLELCFTGSLRELTLTGLPQLQHLKVTQQPPRSEPKVTVQCKALHLPHSLLSFHLTVTTESLQLGEQLSVLLSLPQLETVGLHGPLFGKIPALPTTLTSLDLSDSWLVDTRSYKQLSLMTHLKELILPHPLPQADPQGWDEPSEDTALQGILKRHHVQLRYKDSDPFTPSTGGTCLHPCCPSPATAAPPDPTPPDDIDVAANFAELEPDLQQALWADAHAVHHAV